MAGGMYALVVLLAMSLTGLTWSFDWYRNAFYAVCGVEYTPRNSGMFNPDIIARKRQACSKQGNEKPQNACRDTSETAGLFVRYNARRLCRACAGGRFRMEYARGGTCRARRIYKTSLFIDGSTSESNYKINQFYGYSFRYDCECEKAVAAICNGASFLAKHGFLNTVKHTGNGPEQLRLWGGDLRIFFPL